MMKKSLSILSACIVLGCSVLWQGCAAGKGLERWPSRQIDRPFTIPKGMSQWSSSLIYSHLDDPTGPKDYFLPWPLTWRTPLSDDWTLHWLPIPLMVSHQVHWDGTTRFGLVLAPVSGFGVRTTGPSVLSTTVALSFRQKLGADTALDASASCVYWVDDRFTHHRSELDLRAGPFFQVADGFALSPFGKVELIEDRGIFAGGNYQGFFDIPSDGAVFGLGASLGLVLDRQWDMDLYYQYGGLGNEDATRSHTAALSFDHNW